MDGHTWLVVFSVAWGTGIFLRLVAKEKHRREKYLSLRLLEKARELEEEEEHKRQLAEELRRQQGAELQNLAGEVEDSMGEQDGD